MTPVNHTSTPHISNISHRQGVMTNQSTHCADTNDPIDTTEHRAKRHRRGRVRTQNIQTLLQQPKRIIPSYQLLTNADLILLEQHADWLLETVGVDFRGDEQVLALLKQAGAIIDKCRVRFPAGLARELCQQAPHQFTLHSRNPSHSVVVGDNHLVLMPGYGSPFVNELDQGRRYATLEDFHNFVKLTYMTPYLQHSGGTVVEPVDIPVNKRHLDMVAAHLCLSDKPFMGSVTSPERARDSIAMAKLVFGNTYLQDHVVMQANININSPLVLDETMSGALREYAKANQCVCVSPAIFAGAMGPVTPAALAAQTLAEAMAVIALIQTINPGCPVVMGSFHSTMNLRSGALTFGTPEANLATMALSQLGIRLGVPVRSGGGQITSANTTDAQAMSDSNNAMWAALISGSHQVWHAAGWLEGGLTMSYEKFILDIDNCGSMLRLLQGMAVDKSSLTKESYAETAPGGNFLSTSHTLANFANANYESLLKDTGPYETWQEQGSQNAAKRANGIWKRMLEDYIPPTIDSRTKTKLQDYIAARKAEMPDQWY